MNLPAISSFQAHPTFRILPERWTRRLALAAALVLAGLFREPLLALLSVIKDRDAILASLEAYGRLGMVVLFGVLFLQVILAAIPGQLLMIAGGYLYGFTAAFLIVHASTVLASQFCYWLARVYGRPVVRKLAPAELVDTWTARAEKQGIVFFLFSFILPIFPSDVMNFVAGLSGISSRKFFAANFFGRLPTSILFALIGAQGFRLSPAWLAAAVIFTVVAFAVWKKVASGFERS